MIEVICKENYFLARGTFSIGLAGIYENKNFDDKKITIRPSLHYMLRELEKDTSSLYNPLFPFLKNKRKKEELAKGLEVYYNQKETELRQHLKKINGDILFHLFSYMEHCAFPFWEMKQAVISGSMDFRTLDKPENQIYSPEKSIRNYQANLCYGSGNETVPKSDIESKLRELYPMFNFDGLYASVIPEYLCLNGRFLEAIFSDSWGRHLFNFALNCLDEIFMCCEWENN